MKTTNIFKSVFFLFFLFAFITCDVSDSDIMSESNPKNILTPKVKSITGANDYLAELNLFLKDLYDNKQIKKGSYNTLKVKVTNAIKNLAKSKNEIARNQMGIFLKQVKVFGRNSTITDVIGAELTKRGENSILLIDGYYMDKRDGNKYPVVKIGDQIWMAKNLAYLPKVFPQQDGSLENSRYYVHNYYGDDVLIAKNEFYYKEYGVLYNWPAAMESSPDGWHLPSEAEWLQLVDFCKPYSAQKLREAGYEHWLINLKPGWIEPTNETGFTALPGGGRTNSQFDLPGSDGWWWTSTPTPKYLDSRETKKVAWLYRSAFELSVGASMNDFAISVRCIRD